jgi:hypothetical protein
MRITVPMRKKFHQGILLFFYPLFDNVGEMCPSLSSPLKPIFSSAALL